jgi:hypothetical protein
MKRKAVPNDFWDLTKLDSGTIVYDIIRGSVPEATRNMSPDLSSDPSGQNSSYIETWELEVRRARDPNRSDNSLRLIIMRGPAGWCCYIGVPLDSPLAGLPYSGEMDRFECHGGLTFAGAGDGIHRPEGWYYFGWDYAHSGDWTAYIASIEEHSGGPISNRTGLPVSFPASATSLRKWTFGEVKEEIEAGYQQLTREINLRKSKVFPKRFFNRKRLIRVNGAE